MMDYGIGLADIEQARDRIAGTVSRTAVNPSLSLGQKVGVPVHMKLEHTQITGSFKLRGAANALAMLSDSQRAKGVVAVSTGNHGRAVAHAARVAGVKAVICLSELVPRNKVAAIEALGAELQICGRSQDEAEQEALRLEREGMTYISPFDNPDVIAGQGTLGLEMLEDMPEAETVVVPLSGGGLLSGVALAMKTHRPDIRLVGVTMSRGAAMYESLKAGQPVEVAEVESLADSLGGGIGLQNRYTFAIVRDLVERCLLVEEEELAEAIRHAYLEEQQVLEGGAAAGIAALLSGRLKPQGPTLVVLSGRNLDMDQHRQLVCSKDGGALEGKDV
ncbi:hydroxyectoine utilization dehydratase EutB [Fodinicurvata fenggangensis]|uniref:hydroxyectoine utilization dehydratase EutB n=1 Tax=Fodinicurvata fenggangensis TaxID=1121830 RepID=UPI001FDECC26|nr:hydroxyectoine utilization dehydratase EutB [Fodinicurvata fenggangensis]